MKRIRNIALFVILVSLIFGAYKYVTHAFFDGDIFQQADVKLVKEDKWQTVLVNDKHPIDKNYMPKCTILSNGERVDSRIYPHLQEMFDDARKKGYSIKVRSGYRSYDVQKGLWEKEEERLNKKGLTVQKAKKINELFVQKPGHSEHQTGLAVDINIANGKDPQKLYDWLRDNSYKYGFVLRYPEEKIEITGIGYEPWHFRYVGKDAAKIMKKENLCLEEYVDKYE